MVLLVNSSYFEFSVLCGYAWIFVVLHRLLFYMLFVLFLAQMWLILVGVVLVIIIIIIGEQSGLIFFVFIVSASEVMFLLCFLLLFRLFADQNYYSLSQVEFIFCDKIFHKKQAWSQEMIKFFRDLHMGLFQSFV